MDPLTELTRLSAPYLPWACFSVGLMGGLHCLGMCGPLVMASARDNRQLAINQLGRLGGYLFLAMTFSFLGQNILWAIQRSFTKNIFLVFLSALIISILLWALREKMARALRFLHLKLMPKTKNPWAFSFFMGLLTPLLPCSMLYSVFLALTLFENRPMTLLSAFCFWLGTLPWLLFFPHRIRQFVAKKVGRKKQLQWGVVALATLVAGLRFWSLTKASGICHWP